MKKLFKSKVSVALMTVTLLLLSVGLVFFMRPVKALSSKATSLSNEIFLEVMKECNYTRIDEALVFVMAAPMGRLVATPEDEAAYLANPKYLAMAQSKSKCWTPERWERYVRAVLAEERAAAQKLSKTMPQK